MIGFLRKALPRMTRPSTPPTRLDDALLGIAIYYLTSVVMFLGFSFGYQFLVRGSIAAPRGIGLLGAFDSAGGRWYRQILENGYGREPGGHSSAAFFPAYPLISRAVRAASGLPTQAALLVVSNASLFFALIILARYVRARFPLAPQALADWTLLAMGLFPTGCFFRMCYTESTFLLLAIGAMYGIERRWPIPALVFLVGLETATRATGVALLAPLGVYIWQSQPTCAARAWRLALWLPLACWGLIAFMVFQYVAFGEPLAFARAQATWRIGPSVELPAKLKLLVTLEPLGAVYDSSSPAYWAAWDVHRLPWFSLYFANPIFFVASIVLLAIGISKRWLTLGEGLLVALLMLIPFVTRAHEMGMAGMGRFVAVAFPIYIVLGHLLARLPTAISIGFLVIFGFLLGAYSALFAAGYLIV